MKHQLLKWLLIGYFFCQNITAAYAVLDLELTKGVDSAIPIAIVPFTQHGQNTKIPVDVSDIIGQDLVNSGRFSLLDKQLSNSNANTNYSSKIDLNFWRRKNVENVVTGAIQLLGDGNYKVMYTLFDLYKSRGNDLAVENQAIIRQEFTVKSQQLRSLAHHISDQIYQALTGDKGVFSTQIAYVLVRRDPGEPTQYLLEVSDIDGYNPQTIMRSNEPIMSPSWSPDGKKMAYVSFENKRPRVYISELATGKRQMVTSFPGINGAPAWSPDSKQLALALSKGFNPNLYILDLATKKLTQLTTGLAINTEPQWTPGGQSLLFTSDRGGTPQIYRINLANKVIERVTYDGRYNTTASLSPDSKIMVFLHRTDRGFNIATLNTENNNLQVLTQNGFEESPSFAPNGRMIVYATQYGDHGVLGIVSADGRIKLRLPSKNGSVQEPAWSPFRQ